MKKTFRIKSGTAAAASLRNSAGSMRDKRISRAEENKNPIGKQELDDLEGVIEGSSSEMDDDGSCACYFCWDKNIKVGVDIKCEYYKHHCDGCHGASPRRCTAVDCT